MEERPTNLRAMLAAAKDSGELMVDLAYAAVYFGDPQMAEEVEDLGAELTELVHEMRSVCVLAARSPRDADAMSSVLGVVAAIEHIAEAALAIARIVTHKVGIPAELVADLSESEEVSHRVLLQAGSHFAHQPLRAFELPVAVGMRVVAIHRGRSWMTDVDGDVVLLPGDVLFLHGSPAGITRLRQLAGAEGWEPQPAPGPSLAATDLDRAVDVLVTMKDTSMACVGLAWSALVLGDPGLAAEVSHLEARLDEMGEQLEEWVLRAAASAPGPGALLPLRALLRLSGAALDLGDAARRMVWVVGAEEDVHPVLALALGEADEVVVQIAVGVGSPVEGQTLAEVHLDTDPGFHVLALRRGGRYRYRPRGGERLVAGDEVIATGPGEGEARLAELLAGFGRR